MAEKEKSLQEQIQENMDNLGIKSPDELGVDVDKLKGPEETRAFIREKVDHLQGPARTDAKHFVEAVIASERQRIENEQKT